MEKDVEEAQVELAKIEVEIKQNEQLQQHDQQRDQYL